MEKIEFDNETYYFVNGKFYDSAYIELDKKTKQKVAGEYYKGTDIKTLNRDDLLSYIKETKESEAYHLAINAILYGIKNFNEDYFFIKKVLPILTSSYRLLNKPTEAIEQATEILKDVPGSGSPALYTSLAAAYCDVADYEKAKKYADKAFAIGGFLGELSSVYARIKSESKSN